MSESVADSGHDTNSTLDTTTTDTTGTSLTLGKVPPSKRAYNGHVDVLPKLPSHNFRFSVWHDLRETCLTGDQLHAPRVRKGPEEKEKCFYKIEEHGLPIHHDIHGKQRQNYMNQLENWEAAEHISLGYQDLSDDFQRKNFIRILQRCQSAVTVNLVHNELYSLRAVVFPCCEAFNIDNNFLKSFADFPQLPRVTYISAANNAIRRFDGLERLASPSLQELILKGNPVSFYINYRQTVFKVLPNLRLLDGIPRLPSDEPVDIGKEPPKLSKCTIL